MWRFLQAPQPTGAAGFGLSACCGGTRGHCQFVKHSPKCTSASRASSSDSINSSGKSSCGRACAAHHALQCKPQVAQ
jgi:hypothetical protein